MANENANKKGKLATYFRGVRVETNKVTWPTKKELFNYTVTVLLFSVLFTVLVYLLDLGIGYVYSLILK